MMTKHTANGVEGETTASIEAKDGAGRPVAPINWELLCSRSYEDRLRYGDQPADTGTGRVSPQSSSR